MRLKVHHNGEDLLVDANGVAKRPGATCLANLPVITAALKGPLETDGRERIRGLLADALGALGLV